MHRARRPHWTSQYPPARSPLRLGRRSAAAILVASALAGATAYSVGPATSVNLAAAECDQPKAMRQLAAARQTRTDARALLADLRLDGRSDPRAQALSRQISRLGFTPALHDGWRQKAVDVSDQLTGTSDPKLRAVALTLARHGYGPTPADLLNEPPPSPGPDGDLGQALGQGTGSALGGAVDGAAQAADALDQPPAPAAAGKQPKDPQRTKKRTAEPPLPQTCAGSSAAPAEPDRAPATARPDTAASSSAAPPSATSRPAPPRVSSSAAPASPPAEDPPDDPDQTGPATTGPPASSTSQPDPPGAPGPGGGTSDGASTQAADIDQARAAFQLVGELMQALGANGDQESTQLKDLLQQAMNSGAPQLQPSGTAPGSSGGTQTDNDQDTADQDTADQAGPSNSQGGTGGWEPAADKLAEQVSQAAGSDPLAEQLVEKLRDAGVEVPEQGSGTGSSGSGSGSGQGESQTDDGSGSSGTGSGSGSGSGQGDPQTGDGSGGSGSGSGQGDPQTGDGSGDSGSGSGQGHSQTDDGSGGSGDSGSGQGDSQTGDGSDGSGSGGSGGGSGGQEGSEQEKGSGNEGAGSAGGGEQPKDPEGDQQSVEGERGARTEDATWDKLADCESSGDWAADTGNGYSGGLQFSPETWTAFGGQGDPSSASREEQIAVAEKVKAEQGFNSWPSCSRKVLTEQERNMGR